MEVIIPQPKAKHRFNPYQAIISTLDFLKSWGGPILFIYGVASFLLGVLLVPGEAEGFVDTALVFNALIGMFAAVVGFIWTSIILIAWGVDGGIEVLMRRLHEKAYNYGKIED